MRRVYRITGNLAAMRTDAPALLEAAELRKSYGGREALKGVSLEAREGELIACIGPNGAGKTTLLTILAGIQLPDSGAMSTAGRVGWVPQQPALYGKLSVAENLRLFARLDRVPDVEGTVTRMLAETGLAERADDQVARLSGGNRQRVNVAIGLLAAPPVLLLDEPSAALDPRQRERLWEFVGRLAERGTTVVYSTHVVSEADRYATRVLVLADGERLFWGTPGELERAVITNDAKGRGGDDGMDFEAAFVAFLRQRGH
jgi:ABC-2 type transport system ATP-binding protein